MITLGIDIGSLTTKAVVIGDGKVLGQKLVPTGESGRESAARAVQEALKVAGADIKDVAKIVVTGSGKDDCPFPADKATEMQCGVKGAQFLFPTARTVIEMGAESSRVVKCSPVGKVLDFGVNDKCAAGTGIFLDGLAKTALEIPIEQMGPLSLKASEQIEITATCTVFAESEVVGLIARGKEKASILAGVHQSIANRIYGLVNRVGAAKDVVFIGGGARNVGIQKSLEVKVKQALLIPADPDFVGALGAAVVAQERSANS